MIILKIDVTKLNKEHFFKGAKGTYCDLVVMENDEPDQYGNTHVVKQGVSKEARDAGTKGAIVGNGKTYDRQTKKTPAKSAPRPQRDPALDPADDGSQIPF